MITVSRHRPWWRAIRSRVPTMRNPACWCSRTLAVFSGNRLLWMVQIPAASVEPISARSSAAPIPRRWHPGQDVDAVLDDPRVHAPGRDRGNGDPAEHPPVSIGGGEPVPRELRRVEGLPVGRRRLEAGLAGVQPGLVDRQHLAGVGRLHRPDDDPGRRGHRGHGGRGRRIRWLVLEHGGPPRRVRGQQAGMAGTCRPITISPAAGKTPRRPADRVPDVRAVPPGRRGQRNREGAAGGSPRWQGDYRSVRQTRDTRVEGRPGSRLRGSGECVVIAADGSYDGK